MLLSILLALGLPAADCLEPSLAPKADVGLRQAPEARELIGKVQALDAEKLELVLTDAAKKKWTFTLTQEGKVYINEREATLADLQVDNEVTVTYVQDGEKLMASRVVCKRK